MRCALLLVLLFLYGLAFGQTPSHYILGEEELSGVHIYDINQDQNNLYWITTNSGIYNFNGLEFTKRSVENAKGKSFFNLINYRDKILFSNLSGQFFLGDKDSIVLYYEIPDSLKNHEFSYYVDENGDLIISSLSIFKLDTNKDIHTITKLKHTLSKAKKGIYYNGDPDQISLIKNTKVSHYPIKNPISNSRDNIIIDFYNKRLLFKKDRGEIYEHKNDSLLLRYNQHQKLGNIYQTESFLWVAYISSGVDILDSNLRPTTDELVFPNDLISTVYEDTEGNIILGTFGEGIYIVPNIHHKTINSVSRNDKVRKICIDKRSNVYLGTLNGTIIKLDNFSNREEFIVENAKSIEFLEYIPHTNELIYDNLHLSFRKIGSGDTHNALVGSPKDLYIVNQNEYLIATNAAINSYRNSLKYPSAFNIKNTHKHFSKISGFEERFFCVGYDSLTKTLYAGGSLGFKISQNGEEPYYYTINKNVIHATDMITYNGKTYVCTQQQGILIFKGSEMKKSWGSNLNTPFFAIKSWNKNFIASSKNGMYIFDGEGNINHIINHSEGLLNNAIMDFDITGDTLYIVNKSGVQYIDLNLISDIKYVPNIEIIEVQVNDSVIGISNKNEFNHTFNKFSFKLSTNSLKYRNEISYKYRLKPIENSWVETGYFDNTLEYKSLSPGEYIFEAKVVFRGKESSVARRQFSISKPFYQSWAFLLLLTIFVIVITAFVYYNQSQKKLRKQKLLNELNKSKLTAIQSQMNPHFIFNALNSIQDLVLKEDIDNSYSYITKFANLVRKTLNYSDKDFIPFEDELSLIELYLTIEKLRMEDDFSYTIESKNIDGIKIPPMLIQPFIENAIKHGLLHLQGTKHLHIAFKLNDVLTCTIEDNGVGRERAAEIKSRQNNNNESFSVSAIQQRFNILKAFYGKGIGIKYHDINHNGKTGTIVELKLPVQRIF